MSAEKGAYLATSVAPLPTLFEVLAASNLSDLLKPVVGHLTDCLLSWKPEWHRLLVPARKVAWILAILGVDGYHLKHYDSLFAENFYGLKRIPVREGAWRLKSLVFFLLNQFKQDFDAWYESLRYDVQHGAFADKSFKSRLIRVFVWLYPLLHMLHMGGNFCFHLAYVLGRSRFPSLEVFAAGVSLSNASSDDEEQENSDGISRPLAALRRWAGLFLTLAIFLLQFLQSRAREDLVGSSAAAVQPPPPPPPLRTRSALPADPRLCPLCLQRRRDSACLSASGIIFCYSCIRDFVIEHGMCPITKHPAGASSIIRLFK